MMLIITCASGVPGRFDKNGGVWCILSVPKLVINNLKINISFYNKSKNPNFVPYFSLRLIQMRTLAQINTFTFYKGDWGGGVLIALRSQRNSKKWRLYVFFTANVSHTGRKDMSCNDVDSDSC